MLENLNNLNRTNEPHFLIKDTFFDKNRFSTLSRTFQV